MTNTFTAVYQKVEDRVVAWVEELPGANTQGATLEEARENLRDAVALILSANREIAEKELGTQDVIREEMQISA